MLLIGSMSEELVFMIDSLTPTISSIDGVSEGRASSTLIDLTDDKLVGRVSHELLTVTRVSRDVRLSKYISTELLSLI